MAMQFETNMTTYYLIIPILVLALGGLVWFIIKMKTTFWKKFTLLVISFFAFFGFIFMVLTVYYQFNEPFAGMFKFYAYSKLTPGSDPFGEANEDEGSIIRVLGVTEVSKEGGQVILPNLSDILGYDYGGYLFTPGKWQTVKVDDNVMTLLDLDSNGKPDIINTSLWWALTKDPYKLTESVE